MEGGGHGTLGKLWHTLQHLAQANRYEMTVALVALVIIVVSKKISRKVPAELIAVIGALIASAGVRTRHKGDTCWEPFRVVCLTSVCPTRLELANHHDVDSNGVRDVRRHSGPKRRDLERLCHALRREVQREHRPGRLALANIGAGLSGTFVVNGSPTKTQIVDTAGGRSQLSLLVMAAIVLLVLLFLTGPLAFMPESALSAIVFLIGIGLIDIAGMRKIFTERRSEFWVALITALTVVIVGVEEGILLAIALSLIDHTRHGYRPKKAVHRAWRRGPRTTAGGDGRASCAGSRHLPVHAQLVLRELSATRG